MLREKSLGGEKHTKSSIFHFANIPEGENIFPPGYYLRGIIKTLEAPFNRRPKMEKNLWEKILEGTY